MTEPTVIIDIKRAVSDGKKVVLQFFREGKLWYQTEHGELFSIDTTDTKDVGGATFNATEKAMYLMRYMRKWNESQKD